MTEPRLSIHSAKAKELAEALARRTGLSLNRLVEQALEHYAIELGEATYRQPIDAAWELAAEGRRHVPAATTSPMMISMMNTACRDDSG
ncbi:type II toxin-antitoxin system VapB family antitoxin [Brucella sp. IR073]|uniref:type II toxin-antitoxin system VapB family antitoxin n=1 Tax=unclassified Brucella TaxID=2632610 RepID=UPI003B986D4B